MVEKSKWDLFQRLRRYHGLKPYNTIYNTDYCSNDYWTEIIRDYDMSDIVTEIQKLLPEISKAEKLRDAMSKARMPMKNEIGEVDKLIIELQARKRVLEALDKYDEFILDTFCCYEEDIKELRRKFHNWEELQNED